MFLIFVLGPIIEGLRRKKQPPPPPPPRRHVPPPAPTQPQRSRMEEMSSRPRAEENASTMVPDDLWEILTGQKRVPLPPTAPAPTPDPTTAKKPSRDVVFD